MDRTENHVKPHRDTCNQHRVGCHGPNQDVLPEALSRQDKRSMLQIHVRAGGAQLGQSDYEGRAKKGGGIWRKKFKCEKFKCIGDRNIP